MVGVAVDKLRGELILGVPVYRFHREGSHRAVAAGDQGLVFDTDPSAALGQVFNVIAAGMSLFNQSLLAEPSRRNTTEVQSVPEPTRLGRPRSVVVPSRLVKTTSPPVR